MFTKAILQHLVFTGVAGWSGIAVSVVQSEPLFVVLCLYALYCLQRYLRDDKKILFLYISSLFIGLSIVTRYAGIALIATALFCEMLRSNFKLRFKRVAIIISIGLLPIGLFFIYNKVSYGLSHDRKIQVSSIAYEDLNNFIVSFISSIFPGVERITTAPIIPFVAFWCLILFICYHYSSTEKILLNILNNDYVVYFAFAILHLLTILFCRFIFDPAIRFEPRIVQPFVLGLFIPFGIYIISTFRNIPTEKFKVFFGSTYLLYFFLYFLVFSSYMEKNGRGPNNVKHFNKAIISYIQNHDDLPIFTNNPAAAYLLTGRKVYSCSESNKNNNGRYFVLYYNNSIELTTNSIKWGSGYDACGNLDGAQQPIQAKNDLRLFIMDPNS